MFLKFYLVQSIFPNFSKSGYMPQLSASKSHLKCLAVFEMPKFRINPDLDLNKFEDLINSKFVRNPDSGNRKYSFRTTTIHFSQY